MRCFFGVCGNVASFLFFFFLFFCLDSVIFSNYNQLQTFIEGVLFKETISTNSFLLVLLLRYSISLLYDINSMVSNPYGIFIVFAFSREFVLRKRNLLAMFDGFVERTCFSTVRRIKSWGYMIYGMLLGGKCLLLQFDYHLQHLNIIYVLLTSSIKNITGNIKCY